MITGTDKNRLFHDTKDAIIKRSYYDSALGITTTRYQQDLECGMVAEHLNMSLVQQINIPPMGLTPKGYFRSKLFIAPNHPNPLISAAAPIFSLLERLHSTKSLPPIEQLHQNITHELHAFQSRLHNTGYPLDFHVIANYLISATIDELLGKSYLRVYGQAQTFQAFTPLSNDSAGPEKRFFDIVNFAKGDPNQYLDLIELAYYCLVTGFEGEQHLRPDGRQNLENLIDELYHLVENNRVNKKLRLFREAQTPAPKKPNYLPLMSACIGGALLVVCAFLITQSRIEHQAQSVLLGHSLFARLNTNGN